MEQNRPKCKITQIENKAFFAEKPSDYNTKQLKGRQRDYQDTYECHQKDWKHMSNLTIIMLNCLKSAILKCVGQQRI